MGAEENLAGGTGRVILSGVLLRAKRAVKWKTLPWSGVLWSGVLVYGGVVGREKE